MPARGRGFTLVELLVVMTLLASLLGLALLSLGSAGPARALGPEAGRLALLIEVLAEDAVLDNREYGLWLGRHGYHALRYDERQARWLPTGRDARRLPEGIELALRLDAQALPLAEQPPATPEPQLRLDGDGETAAFRVELRSVDGAAWAVVGDGLSMPRAAPVTP